MSSDLALLGRSLDGALGMDGFVSAEKEGIH